MYQVVSLQEQCLRCIIAHLSEYSAEHMSKVPYKLRYGLLQSLSLADVWKLEDVLAEQVGVDVTRVWEQFMRDHRVSPTGLDFVHGYHEDPPQGKATFTKSLSDREICFQRLWNDLERLKHEGDRKSVPPIQRLLFSVSYDPLDRDFAELVPDEFKLDSTATDAKLILSETRLFIVAAIQTASRARPMYLRHCSIMDYLNPKENPFQFGNVVKQLLSNVIAINISCEEMEKAWFDSLLSNGIPTLKLCVHYDLFRYVCTNVRKCAERKQLDEIIIRLRDEVLPILEISRFTEEIVSSQYQHLRLLEINSLHQPQLASVIPAKFAPSFEWFMEQPQFSCLRLSGVVSTSMAKSLILTFLSTPCGSAQRLELSSMYADREGALEDILPEHNDHYTHKYLLLDSLRMAHAKTFNTYKYRVNSHVVEHYYFPNTENRKAMDGTLTAWLFSISNLKIGSLEIYDYRSHCIHTTLPSTAYIEELKIFIVVQSEEENKCIWISPETTPLFKTILVHPTLHKCLLDLRILKLSSSKHYYFKDLSRLLLQHVPLGNLSILSITINKDVARSEVRRLEDDISYSLPILALSIETSICVRERHL